MLIKNVPILKFVFSHGTLKMDDARVGGAYKPSEKGRVRWLYQSFQVPPNGEKGKYELV